MMTRSLQLVRGQKRQALRKVVFSWLHRTVTQLNPVACSQYRRTCALVMVNYTYLRALLPRLSK
ncbi:mCG1039121 [Mus musculus]|nr:mCG1039121 [Mus musculus]